MGSGNNQEEIIEIEAKSIDLEKLNNLPQISFLSIKECLKKKYALLYVLFLLLNEYFS